MTQGVCVDDSNAAYPSPRTARGRFTTRVNCRGADSRRVRVPPRRARRCSPYRVRTFPTLNTQRKHRLLHPHAVRVRSNRCSNITTTKHRATPPRPAPARDRSTFTASPHSRPPRASHALWTTHARGGGRKCTTQRMSS
jgi:hypothetical protein